MRFKITKFCSEFRDILRILRFLKNFQNFEIKNKTFFFSIFFSTKIFSKISGLSFSQLCPKAFPARISLRPHTSFDMEHSRNMARAGQEGKVPIDPLRREHTSPYSNIVVEKELERRRKLRENRIRQEINTYRYSLLAMKKCLKFCVKFGTIFLVNILCNNFSIF